ncbi:AAA family ATPase [Rudaea cellulosilytica]|uniref:AAA family ATPase n=1 Tax=Rudaea cellulosilytica TaxID=540746 RepID=UPI0003A378F7|nr:AAA family ATPase [Rudaea cellulosilytica]
MHLQRISIKNYKSLRDIDLAPSSFSIFVGRNGSGKSNFADALDFIAIAYSHGLEHAVTRKGGYENIAHIKQRRSKSAISMRIELSAEFDESDLIYASVNVRRNRPERKFVVLFRHEFSIKTAGEGIRSDFKIVNEKLELIKQPLQQELLESASYEWLNIERDVEGRVALRGDLNSILASSVFYNAQAWSKEQSADFVLSQTELLFTFPLIRPKVIRRFTAWLNRLSIFQVSPDASRHAGVPTPNPTLSTRGENLPAVVDWLQSKCPKEWRSILRAMKEIVPELSDVTVSYLHTRTLGLFFKESGVGRPWSAEEVSDGTIRALAMLVACFDPRISALVLEEPENSLHPWIIREVVKQLRKLSFDKLVIVTTHSPIVVNIANPNEVWVVYKKSGETAILPLVSFDPMLEADWEAGKFRLFDYLESGVVPEAVPTGAG